MDEISEGETITQPSKLLLIKMALHLQLREVIHILKFSKDSQCRRFRHYIS